MEEVLSHDFGNIVGDFGNNDSDIEQEEEENRQREIQGLLADQFDEISSIGEDDDDDDESDDPNSISMETRNKGIISTPLSESPPRVKKSFNNFGTIPEESTTGSFEDAAENIRKEADDTGDGFHVRYLLDENNHLSAETTKLKHHLSVVSGDYEGLQYKYQRLEDEVREKDEQLLQLSGKVAALEIQLQSESDAKKEYSRKFSLAESTIQSLQRQMSELSKSDCLVRLQSNHDTLLKKLKEDHENELFGLREKIEDLVINLEEKQSRIQELEKELKQNQSQVSEMRRKSFSEMNKSSPTTLKNTALFESLQSVKKELENAMEGKQELRNQNEAMKKQLSEYKNQNCDLSTILREKDILINELRAESRRFKNLDIGTSENLKTLTEKLKVKEELCESKTTQIAQLERLLRSAKNEVEELKLCNQELRDKVKTSENGAVNLKEDLFTQAEVQKMVKEATEDWRKSTEANYQEQYLKQMKKLEISYENSKEEIVRDYRSRLTEQVKEVSDLMAKLKETEDEKRKLEKAYASTLIQPSADTDTLCKELNEVKKRLDDQGEKLKKYRIMCKELQSKKTKEVEKLKSDFTAFLKAKKEHYEAREEKLRVRLISQWNKKCQNIEQAFRYALLHVENEADGIIEQYQHEPWDLVMVALRAYHEAVQGKINSLKPSTSLKNESDDDL